MTTQTAERIVGIIGGMGPEATVDLMQRIIRLTPALDDVDHIRCIVDNNPKIPSRIKAIIEGGGEDPAPHMAEMGRRLEAWGADFLAIPCNTAHYYHGAVQRAVGIPVLHMIDLTVRHVADRFPGLGKVGILASPAVAMTGLYGARLGPLGIEDVWPDAAHQGRLLGVIKDIKKGAAGDAVQAAYRAVCRHLADRGVSLAVVACTELSAVGGAGLPIETVDASDVLAREIVRLARDPAAPIPPADCMSG